MRLAQVLTLFALFALPTMVGCGRGSSTAPVADQDGIAAYVAANPNSDAGTEPEGGE